MAYSETIVRDQSLALRLARDDANRLVVVDRDGERNVVFQCPCGCAEILVINVDARLQQSWRLRRSRKGLSLIPSVWRTSGCRSHFVLWDSRVWWCGPLDDADEDPAKQESWPRGLLRELRRVSMNRRGQRDAS